MSIGDKRGSLPIPAAVLSTDSRRGANDSLFAKLLRFFEDEEPGAVTEQSPVVKQPLQLKPSWYYWIFAASGFAGLIYESIWARYLKLILGHAAYAQALVLAIFLLGLAIGAALCARFSSRLPRPFLWYAGIEILLALVAMYFHDIFVAVWQWASVEMLPQIESDKGIELFKWLLSMLLILPQSLLLGATFPLISAGTLRLWPRRRGRIIAMLYFSNSFGAVLGVLLSSFVLLPFAGLPGSLAIAGLINVAAAAAVWVLGHVFNDTGEPLAINGGADRDAAPAESTFRAARLKSLIATIAFATGLASFIYEIVWIRMLSLLLGSSTRTFEFMLAAFILGLALGSFAVRRREDGGGLLVFLGKVQIAMGTLALWSLLCFPLVYEILHNVLSAIPRDDIGYWSYTLLAFALSLLLLLPASFCAGMTLPLLTRHLLAVGGEAAIGGVYAANTLGAIVGVFLALHVLLPLVGLQGALLIGAAVDMLLGVVLIGFFARRYLAKAVSTSVAMLAAAVFFGSINVRIASAGVFRHQQDALPQVVYYRDGKTASIAVTEFQGENSPYPIRSIRTNGKSDAAVLAGGNAGEHGYGVDEMTMVLLGLLPLLHKPDAERVMNIGFGSGLTSRTLLLSRQVTQLDNVEIEPFMIEGARLMGSRVAPVFEDARNHFIINDAKTVLARAPALYDVIVSEPSDPWVSGIASLFTKEFYQQVRSSLAPEGIFVQWLPLHGSEARIVASVGQALAAVFGDFKVYLSANNNIIFIASPTQNLPEISDAIYSSEEARVYFSGYDFPAAQDVEALLLGSKRVLLPYFESFNAPVNSDYHPYLEDKAQRAFFGKTSYALSAVSQLPVPVWEILGQPSKREVQPARHSQLMHQIASAHRHYARRLQEGGLIQSVLADFSRRACPTVEADVSGRKSEDEAATGYMQTISDLIARLMPALDKDKMTEVWQLLEQNECIKTLLAKDDSIVNTYIQFWRALSLRQGKELVRTTELLLPNADLSVPSGQILILAAMAGHYQLENYQQVVLLMLGMPQIKPVVHHAARLLSANAVAKI